MLATHLKVCIISFMVRQLRKPFTHGIKNMKTNQCTLGQAVKVKGNGGRLLDATFVKYAKDGSPIVFIPECNAQRNVYSNQMISN